MPPVARILIIEDEPAIADSLVYALRTEGFAPVWRRTGGDGLAALAAESFALVVIDVGLPDLSGFEVCKTIRGASAVPVIFLTARNAEIDRVLGLELGGDDYLAKPFSPREFTARVKAILRRANGGVNAGEIRTPVSGLVIDEGRCAASLDGVRLSLTRYEFRLLKALASRPGRVFSRERLMSLAWEEPEASFERTVDAHIKTLRAKLRAVRPEPDLVVTHRGIGYALREDG